MKTRLQLINGYLKGTLTNAEMAHAEANPIVMAAVKAPVEAPAKKVKRQNKKGK